MPFIFKRITLTNDSASKKDGTGAQIQRVLAIASLAERLQVPFQQSKIIDVAVHPLDPFQDAESYQEYLKKLNFTFEVKTNWPSSFFGKRFYIKNLSVFKLLKVSVLSYISRQNSLILVENPYAVSDLNVDDYLLIVRKLRNIKELENQNQKRPSIAIHYRQGVGNYAVYPGQSIPREIDIEYFRERIAQHLRGEKNKDIEVHVFTDSPDHTIQYTPPVEQTYLWEGTPGFANGVMHIQPLLFSPETLGVKNVVVHSGGDPVDAIIRMANSSLLITGRSSLSYIAGLLNTEGTVVKAPDFWHPPLSSWVD